MYMLKKNAFLLVASVFLVVFIVTSNIVRAADSTSPNLKKLAEDRPCEYACVTNNSEYTAASKNWNELYMSYVNASNKCKEGSGYEMDLGCLESVNSKHLSGIDQAKNKSWEVYNRVLSQCESQCQNKNNTTVSEKSGEGVSIDKSPDSALGKWFDTKAKTDIKIAKGTYVTINGKKMLLTKGVELKPGAVIEIEEEGGQAMFTLSTGEVISLLGKGTKIEIISPDSVTKKEWKSALERFIDDRIEEIRGEEGRRGRSPRNYTTVHSGSMVFKYETGGKKGLWNFGLGRTQADDEDQGPGSVFFNRVIDQDENTGEMIAVMFDNYSTVEYINDSETNMAEVKVYEGEVIGYAINLDTSEREEIIRVATGEKISFSIDNNIATQITKSGFDPSEKSEAMLALEEAEKKPFYTMIGATTVVVVLGLIILVFVLIKKKVGRKRK